MESDSKCAACQSARTEPAKLDGMAVTLDRAGTLKKLVNPVGHVHCRVCMDCGALTGFRVDPEMAARSLV